MGVMTGHEGRINCITGLVYPSQTHLPASSLAMLGASTESSKPYKSLLNILTGGQDGTVRLWKEDRLKKMDDAIFLGDSTSPGGRSGRYIMGSEYPESFEFSCEHVFRLGLNSAITNIKLHPGGTHYAVTRTTPDWYLINAAYCVISRKFDEENIKVT